MSDLYDRFGVPTAGFLQALATSEAGHEIASATRYAAKRTSRATMLAALMETGMTPVEAARTVMEAEEEMKLAELDSKLWEQGVGMCINVRGQPRCLGKP